MPDAPKTGPEGAPITEGAPTDPPAGTPGTPGAPGTDPAAEVTDPGKEPGADDVTSNGKPWAVDDSGKKLGYPKDTPNTEMSLEEQTAYWKHHSRAWQRKAQNSKPEEVTKLQERIDELERGQLSESEAAQNDAIATARKEAADEAEAFYRPLLNGMQIQSYAASVLGEERAALWAADTKHDPFIAEGVVDGAKVVEYVKRVFGITETTPPPPPPGTYVQAGQGQPGAVTRLDPTQQSDAQLNKRFPTTK